MRRSNKRIFLLLILVFGTHNFHKFPELFYRSLNTEGQIIDVWKESDEIVEGMPSDRKYSLKRVSILCLAAIISAVTVLYHM